MENKITTAIAIPDQRQLISVDGDIAQEIGRLHQEVLACVKIGLSNAIRIGELLVEQKAILKHGNFTHWINKNLPFTDRTARNYMRLYEARDELKTETISVLKDAYKRLASPGENTRLERPWELWYEVKGKLAVMNDLLISGEDEQYLSYSPSGWVLTHNFIEIIMQGYLETVDATENSSLQIRELAWASKIYLELCNRCAEIHLRETARLGSIINQMKEDYPSFYNFLEANKYSDAAFGYLFKELATKEKELGKQTTASR